MTGKNAETPSISVARGGKAIAALLTQLDEAGLLSPSTDDSLHEERNRARRELWTQPTDLWSPAAYVLRDGDGAANAAALVTSRALSSYRKIADVIAPSAVAWSELLDAIISAEADGVSVLHCEDHRGIAPLSAEIHAVLRQRGFVSAETPVPSVPSTRSGDLAETAVWSRWSGAKVPDVVPYYGQTTDVTCGAVATLMAADSRGTNVSETTFTREDLHANRDREIGFWRKVTNLPAVDPVALAAEIATLPGHASTRVILSTDEPVLLEWYTEEWERTLRTDLQEQALRKADALGVAVERRWVEVDELRDLMRAGHQLLLLIDLSELINDPTPHWVFASALIESGEDRDREPSERGETVLVSDPWIEYEKAETWADTFALPLPWSTIDRITRWGDPAYRGVIVLPA